MRSTSELTEGLKQLLNTMDEIEYSINRGVNGEPRFPEGYMEYEPNGAVEVVIRAHKKATKQPSPFGRHVSGPR